MTTTEDVIRLAEAAGFDAAYITPSGLKYVLVITEMDEVNIFEQVSRLIALAKDEAFEECAELCELREDYMGEHAAAIRARNKEQT